MTYDFPTDKKPVRSYHIFVRGGSNLNRNLLNSKGVSREQAKFGLASGRVRLRNTPYCRGVTRR